MEGIKEDEASDNEEEVRYVAKSLGNREYAPEGKSEWKRAKDKVGSALTPAGFGLILEVAEECVVNKVPGDFTYIKVASLNDMPRLIFFCNWILPL